MPGTVESPDRNVVVLEGRLSADPELRVLPSGDQVVGLRVVVRRRTGERVDSLPIAVGPPPAPGRRRQPEQASRRVVDAASRLAEGDRVVVEGWLERRFWDAGGSRRTRLQVVATSLRRLAGADGG